MLGNSNFVGIKIQSELIQLLQAKTVATFSKIRLGEKSFSHSAGKKCFLYKKKGKKKSYCKEKIIISSLFSGDMAAAHVIANALYF